MAADRTRRAVLAGTATLPLAVLVAGCRGTEALGKPPAPAPDVDVLRAATAAEAELVARYRSAIRVVRDGGTRAGRVPAASATLAALLTEHEAHLRELRERLVPGSALAAPPSPLPTSSAAPAPPTAARAVTELTRAEQAASARLATQAVALPPALAQLLASIAASEATHVPVLRRLRVS